MRRSREVSGFTLTEVADVAATIGALVMIALPSTRRYLDNQSSLGMALSIARAFEVAHAEARRTGRNHVVFFSVGGAGDGGGNALLDANAQPAAVVVLDDGPTGAPDQNCQIEPDENTRAISVETGLSWGATFAGTTKAPGDLSSVPLAPGSTFTTPNGLPSTWVLFRPDGVPVAADSFCNTGTVGSGNGGIYFTNGARDHAITLTALGDATVHTWDRAAGAWKS